MQYQGRLMSGTNLVNGPVNLMFRMHDHPTDKSILFEATNRAVAVDGVYVTAIGEHVVAGDLDSALAAPEVWLEVFVNGFDLSPRERLLAVPYARMAQLVNGLSIDPVTGSLTMLQKQSGNQASSASAVVSGGSNNQAEGLVSVIAGGSDNAAESTWSVVSGGWSNRSAGLFGTIPGGSQNHAVSHAFAAGNRAKANHTGSFVWGDSTNADITSTTNNQVTFRANGGFRLIGGAYEGNAGGLSNFPVVLLRNNAAGGSGRLALQDNHTVAADWSATLGGINHVIESGATYGVIAGGSNNILSAQHAAIGGGQANRIQANADNAVVAGGRFNRVLAGATHATIAGGGNHEVMAAYGSIAGGLGNKIFTNAFYAAIGGGTLNYINTNSPYAVISGGLGNEVRAGGEAVVVGGGYLNSSGPNATNAVIGGGRGNVVNKPFTTIAGGRDNQVLERFATVAGGERNTVASAAQYAAISGGSQNHIANNALYATIGGGWTNTASGGYATIGGGLRNVASGADATVGGGHLGTASGFRSTIPGGSINEAAGDYSLAAGRRAKAIHNGTFVWADSQNADISSTTADQVTLRAGGGVRVVPGSANPVHLLTVAGTIRAYEVIVDTGWADYVFEPDFVLRDLDEVEAHIAAKGHLPDIPSAADIQANGVNIGEMQTLMMQKIEELTLYIIEQNKRIATLEAALHQP
jgi:hypothetical protein